MHPHDTTMPHELTHEELGRLAFDAYHESGDDEETVEDWTNVARALREAIYPPEWRRGDALTAHLVTDLTHECERLRAELAALLPAVPPLAPGETVTIPDAEEDGSSITVTTHAAWCVIDPVVIGEPAGVPILLNAAGVAQLERACQRWRAAQNETSGVRKSLESATGAEKA